MIAPGGDQTRGDSSLFLDASLPATLSCNEAAALAMKAARGAGMAWGLAEEAGFATAWLVERGVDGPASLHAHLTHAEGLDWSDLCPKVAPGAWGAVPGGTLCPIALGATLCDHAALPAGPLSGPPLAIGPVAHPLLLLPFLAVLAGRRGCAVDLAWEDHAVAIGAPDGWLDAAVTALSAQGRLWFELDVRAAPWCPAAPAAPPAIAAATIAGLTDYALRTTVPASVASRAGAGATTPDDD